MISSNLPHSRKKVTHISPGPRPEVAVARPTLVQANWYAFGPNERIRHEVVGSTCVVWCLRGLGSIHSGGSTFDIRPSVAVLMPWNHDVTYLASLRTPFVVGALHLVPWHDAGTSVERRAAHSAGDPVSASGARRSVPGIWERPASAHTATSEFLTLAAWGVDAFQSHVLSDEELRSLAVLCISAFGRSEQAHRNGRVPASLQTMQDFILTNISSPISVKDVVTAGRCSSSTAERLFTEYTGNSVQVWIRRQRMATAAELLGSTSMRVREVASSVGFADALYFSRVFRTEFGVPPREFAKHRSQP